MNRAALVLSALAFLSLLACDDQEKKKAELLAKAGVDASAAVSPTVPSASAAPTAVRVLAPAKPPKECSPGPELALDDLDLEAELRLKLKKPKDTSPAPLTMKDLATVTSVNLTKKASLAELDPCIFPKMTALKFLYLPKGEYRDLSPIANLTKLEALRVSISEVEDLKPLEKLTALDQLDLGRTHVRDISSLASLVNLTELALDDAQISDLSPLAKCAKLEKLSIKNTLVTDVSPLKDLKKLKSVDVSGTAIGNLDVLAPARARGLKIITR